MDDLLGYRKLLGAVIPDDNTVVLPDFYRVNLTGVTAHSSDFAKKDGRGLAIALGEAIERMDARAPISIALALDEELTGEGGIGSGPIAASFGRSDLLNPSSAIREAVARFGEDPRVAIVSPFSADRHAAAIANLRTLGLRVVADRCAGFERSRDAARMSYVKMRELYDAAVAEGAADLVLQIGHNLPMARLVGNLEEDHGRPVLAINTILVWKMLRDAGILDPIPGLGTLLFDH